MSIIIDLIHLYIFIKKCKKQYFYIFKQYSLFDTFNKCNDT